MNICANILLKVEVLMLFASVGSNSVFLVFSSVTAKNQTHIWLNILTSAFYIIVSMDKPIGRTFHQLLCDPLG